MASNHLTQSLKAEANRIGFDLVGACPAVEATGFGQLQQWLDSGYAGEMDYIAERLDAYRHPNSVLDGCRSILLLGLNYRQLGRQPVSVADGQGRVASYATGTDDYHDRIHGKLKQLKLFAQTQVPGAKWRGVVDTAPLLEREFAQLAGLGWRGKNTLLLNQTYGSWFFIAAMLTDQILQYDDAFTQDHCGTCTACLDQCPTDAFVQPGVLDATRCISYLTIEHRTSIAPELRPRMGDWIFGCDVCQMVCPWNEKASRSNSTVAAPDSSGPPNGSASEPPALVDTPLDLPALFEMDDDEFRARFRKTPLWRPRRRGILRNAAIALGNSPSEPGRRALSKGLRDPDALVRSAAAWALGQFADTTSFDLLNSRLEQESDASVRQEICDAIAFVNWKGVSPQPGDK